MANVYDVDANELIEKAAKELKKIEHIKPPVWAIFVKTGVSKERAPADKDWWYVRAAAVLRTVYRIGPVGVSKLRTRYGSKKSRGFKREHFYRASGNILRKVLQQLEKAGFLKKEEKELRRGRLISPAGKSFLDKIATQIQKGSKKEVVVEKKPQTEAKPEVKEETPKPKVKGPEPNVEEKPAEAPKKVEEKIEAKK